MHRMNGAEPQVVGLTPQTTDEWKANTMKTYILRDPQPVELQKSIRPPRPKCTVPVTVKDPALCIGLDVHNGSIAPESALEKTAGRIAQGHHGHCLGSATATASSLHPSDPRGPEEVASGGDGGGPRTGGLCLGHCPPGPARNAANLKPPEKPKPPIERKK